MTHRNEYLKTELQSILTTFFNKRGIPVVLAANDNQPEKPMVVLERFATTIVRDPDIVHANMVVRLLGLPDLSGEVAADLHDLLKRWQPTFPDLITVMFCLHVLPSPFIKGKVFFAEWVIEDESCRLFA